MKTFKAIDRFPEYRELADLLISYFADDWEEKSDEEIIKDIASGNSLSYLAMISNQITEFLECHGEAQHKLEFVRATGVFYETSKAMAEWLSGLKILMENEITERNPKED